MESVLTGIVLGLLCFGIGFLFQLGPKTLGMAYLDFWKPKQTLREEVRNLRKGKTHAIVYSRLQHLNTSLEAIGQTKTFGWLCFCSYWMLPVGLLLSILVGNLFLAPLWMVGGLCLPFLIGRGRIARYDREVQEELESTLSVLTTSYLRTEDLRRSVEENLEFLKPPMQPVFRKFYSETVLLSSSVEQALWHLKQQLSHPVFAEWCDVLISCQQDHTRKDLLLPVVRKLSMERKVRTAMSGVLGEARKEYGVMVAMVVGNLPLLYVLNREWYEALTQTLPGKLTVSVVFLVIAVTFVLFLRITSQNKQSNR